MGINDIRGIFTGTVLSIGAIGGVTSATAEEVTTIIKDNGARQSVVVVDPSECGDGGGTTYTSQGIIVTRDDDGNITSCGAFTREERDAMIEADRGDDDNRGSTDTPNTDTDISDDVDGDDDGDGVTDDVI